MNQETLTQGGQLVYFGRVFPLRSSEGDVPTYVYERRVADAAGGIVSTHVTRDVAGVVQLAESAMHSGEYELGEYILHANQLGQTGRMQVDGDQVIFRLAHGSKQRSRVAKRRGPVVVGPTLVGYIVRHLDALEQGTSLKVWFAVIDRMTTFGFNLEAIAAAPGQARVRMRPAGFLLRLAVEPTYFTFDAATRKLVRIEGRVPTKIRERARWRDFDARVEYDFVAPVYR